MHSQYGLGTRPTISRPDRCGRHLCLANRLYIGYRSLHRKFRVPERLRTSVTFPMVPVIPDGFLHPTGARGIYTRLILSTLDLRATYLFPAINSATRGSG